MKNVVTQNIKEFIFGGNSEFTIINRINNKSIKYKIGANDNYTAWFVSISESNSYTYAGYFKKDKGKLVYFKGNKGACEKDHPAIKALYWVLANSDKLGEKIDIIHHEKCSVCGRPLTDEESVIRGIGPTCFKKIGGLLMGLGL